LEVKSYRVIQSHRHEQDIFYKELLEPFGTRRADFDVEGKVLVELKVETIVGEGSQFTIFLPAI